MPPKVKTDRDCIVNAAFEVAKVEGITAITAQRVSAVLKTSVAPIFREFQTVEELRAATAEKIIGFHTQYLKNYPYTNSGILAYGIAYIHFAKEYPFLFETIMQPCHTTMNERMSSSLAFVVNSVSSQCALSFEQAKEVFFNIWIYTHGLASLVYRGSLSLTEDEEKKMLINVLDDFSQKYKKCSAPQKGRK